MNKLIFIITIALFSISGLLAQNQNNIVVQARITEDDTMIILQLPEYCVNAKIPRKLKISNRKFSKLVYHVKKVYPYAKLAGIKLNEYEKILLAAEDDKERKQLMKQAEDELKEEFEGELRKLTFKQGHILIKLIDRETGNSSYALIQELRGKFVAFFWQAFARIFGYNLKEEYDPYGKDKDIENIVIMIENGQL
jgi:hypothetical protein